MNRRGEHSQSRHQDSANREFVKTLLDVEVSNRVQVLGLGLVCVLTVACLTVIPMAKYGLGTMAPFLPSVLSIIMFSEWITAFLLFGQFVVSGRIAFAVLGSTFLYSGLIILPHLLSMPGLFSPSGWLGSTAQTATWLWVFWHAGYPLGFIVYNAVDGCLPSVASVRTPMRITWILAGGVLVVVMCVTGIAIFGRNHLPELIHNGNYSELITSGIGLAVLGINLLSVTFLFVRGLKSRSSIHLAVQLTSFTSLLDVSMTLFAGQRYTLGWYSSRLMSLFSGTMVLLFLLQEIARMYHTLVKNQKELRDMVYHDALTGLYNRRYFTEKLGEFIRAASSFSSICMIDIDGFKAVNDTYGHETGDQLLAEIGRRMMAVVRETDIVARLGGDEFVLLISSMQSKAEVEQVAQRMIHTVQQPVRLRNCDVSVTVSMGIVVFPFYGNDEFALIRSADAALYEAKGHGKNQYQIYAGSKAM